MTNHPPTFDRRAFLALIAAAGGVACTGGVPAWTPEAGGGDPGSAEPGSGADGGPAAAPSPEPKRKGPYEPLARDAYPNAKRLAGRFVEALTTYERSDTPQQVLRRASKRFADKRFDHDAVLRRAAPLLIKDAVSSGRVVYPQLSGLTLDPGRERISVMVVVRQTFRGANGRDLPLTRTVDVRMINRDDDWRLEDLADAGGEAVPRPANLAAPAARVLDDPRIALPDSARWDIHRGDIDERLLTTMTELAAVAPYSVAVLKSGHPYNVFGTDVISGHTQGRGVDIWSVAGRPVVLQQPSKKSEAHDFTAAALEDLGVPELGSPWDLDGPPEPGVSKPSFTDAVHADHIHVAFKAA